MPYAIRHLAGCDVPVLKRLLRTFGEAFGAPDTYQSEPLSATTIPYSRSAVRTTRACLGNEAMSKLFLSRTLRPIGGNEGSVADDATCRAGHTYALRVRDTVKRSA